MRVVRLYCETTKEGREYLAYNGYKPIVRISKGLWVVGKIGKRLRDVDIVL